MSKKLAKRLMQHIPVVQTSFEQEFNNSAKAEKIRESMHTFYPQFRDFFFQFFKNS